MNEVDRRRTQLDSELESSLKNAEEIITKQYLEELEKYELVKPSEEDLDIEISKCGKFFKLTKLILNREENLLNKLTTIINVAFSIGGSLATVIRSDGKNIDYYFGIISKQYRAENRIDRERRMADAIAFQGALTGNLAGSELKELSEDEILALQENMFSGIQHSFSSISGVVSLRDEKNPDIETYVQGIENVVDSLRGLHYSIIMIADPISSREIKVIKQGYELIHTQLSTFLQSSLILNESENMSLSKTELEGISKGISKGIAMTQSKAQTKNKSIGLNATVGISIPVTVTMGLSRSVATGVVQSEGKTDSTMESTQDIKSLAKADSKGSSSGKSLQLNYRNRSVKALLDRIDKHLERLDKCENYGAFHSASYIVADTKEVALAVASNYNALMRGEGSYVQAAHINTWNKEEDTALIKKYLESFVHPKFYNPNTSGMNRIPVTPASVVSGNEMAIQIGLPKKSVNGITVIPMAPFGRNTLKKENENGLSLGNLYYMGYEEKGEFRKEIELDLDSLTMHTFVTGSTGSGKSNTIYHILQEMIKRKIPFLVIEPAKGEYKNMFGHLKQVDVFGTNPDYTKLLRINPFSFPQEVHVLEHIDRLIEIFNVCWPMYAAMPAILKEAILQSYKSCGWNLESSKTRYGERKFPTFQDLKGSIGDVIEKSEYSQELKSNYIGSLKTRIHSLTNGLNGLIFCSEELDDRVLFDQNVIVDLSRVGSSETKSLLMGIIVMKLGEYRSSSMREMNCSLKHITVLEEAHNILRKTTGDSMHEGGNIAAKSVEMLSNSIAEMRTYGEGFIIVDQSPGAVDISAIRNTNTKLIMRLPDEMDRRLVGKAVALDERQIDEVSKLSRGVTVVYQNDWLEPVLCKIPKFEGKEKIYRDREFIGVRTRTKDFNTSLLEVLFKESKKQFGKKDIEKLKNQLLEIDDIDSISKNRIIHFIQDIQSANCPLFELSEDQKINQIIFELLDIKMYREDFLNADDMERDARKIVEAHTENLSEQVMEKTIESIKRNFV